MRNLQTKRTSLAIAVVSAISGFTGSALAQESNQSGQLEEIVVTVNSSVGV